jgi:glucosylceramidase
MVAIRRSAPTRDRHRPRRTSLALLGVLALFAALAVALMPTSSRGAPTGSGASLPVQVVQTSANLSQRLTRLADLHLVPGEVHGLPVIHVSDSVGYQRIAGFGASITDTSAWLLSRRLSPAVSAQVMANLFGPAGIHLNVVRIPMGASDYVAGGIPYTYDDLPRGQSDPSLARFSIAHDEAYILPVLRQMLSLDRGVEILASPWSAPAWMKTNDALANPLARASLLPKDYGPFARYFVKFLKAYAAAGVPVRAVTPQNEPALPVKIFYPGMTLTEPDEARFIVRYLSPALRAAALTTRIYGFDFSWYAKAYPTELVSDPAVVRDIAGLAWHCYVGIATTMTALHRLAPRLDQAETECSTGLAPGPPAELVIASTRNWASSVVLWNLALNQSRGPHLPASGCRGCTAVVTVDDATGTVAYTSDYYELGQASAFIQRGAQRIGSENFVRYHSAKERGDYATPGLDDVAFKNPDGSKVLLAYNNSPRPIRFAVAWKGRVFRYTLGGGATVTFVWR